MGGLRDETGAVTIPSIFWLPVFFMILLASVEMMVINTRQVLLDRAVDIATRDLRLGAMTLPTHDTLKTRICDVIAFVSDCRANLAVEVFPIDTTTWTMTNPDAQRCTDSSASEPLVPTIEAGGSNQLVLLRVCLKLRPMTGFDPLAMALSLDSDGRFALFAATAFVNEPRN